MAGSRQDHSRRDPFQRPSLTPGPFGHNDAAAPFAPKALLGETPGPLGRNDGADPSLTASNSDSPILFRTRRYAEALAKLYSSGAVNENSSEDLLLKDPRVRALLNVIGYAEGANYDTMVRGEGSLPITDLSKHPNILVTLNKSLKSTAAGRYQFLYSTWVGLKMPDFSPVSQDKAAIKLFKRRKMLKPLLEGNIEQAIRNGNREWASLPDSPYGQPTRKMKDLLDVYYNSLCP